GGYGLVWEARQKSLDRKVAVKIIKAEKAAIATAMQHAKALAKCAHPNVITGFFVARMRLPVSDKGDDGVVMEWLDRTTLADRIDDARELSFSELEELCHSMLSGLSHIHEQQIAHGDLHSKNVMITPQGIKLIDIDFSKSEVLTRLTSQS